jgi:hypothetical protein
LDERDKYYVPPLIPLASAIDPQKQDWWSAARVRDQGVYPSCTGHALAAIVDHLRARDIIKTSGADGATKKMLAAPWASWRMLFGVARYHDEWLGEEHGGSSIRGALKGFYFNGVCAVAAEPASLKGPLGDPFRWHMTRDVLESACVTRLGAYSRVRPRLADVHAALNETGLILASAEIHDGWQLDRHSTSNSLPIIAFNRGVEIKGRHAFVIVGYNNDGLIVQNSWGSGWGHEGLAVWRYDDWSANVMDMWVLRLAASLEANGSRPTVPQFAHNRAIQGALTHFDDTHTDAPSRLDVIGHMIKFFDGCLELHGNYHADIETLAETFQVIMKRSCKAEVRGYRHVLLHFTGAKRSEEAAAAALRDALPVFKENGVYPIFIVPESDLSAELFATCDRVIREANQRHGMRPSPAKDAMIEGRLAHSAWRLRREIERCAQNSMVPPSRSFPPQRGGGGDAWHILDLMFDELAGRHKEGLSFHVSAHGAGAHFVAALLKAFNSYKSPPKLASLTLIAPMIEGKALEGVREHFCALNETPLASPEIGRLALAYLGEDADREDSYAPGYTHSWPHLWARTYQRAHELRPKAVRRTEAKFLAIEQYANEFLEELDAKRVSKMVLRPQCDPNRQLTHETLENRAPVLDFILQQVLGGPPGGPNFATYYGPSGYGGV